MKCAALVPPSRHEPCDGRDDGACSEGNALKKDSKCGDIVHTFIFGYPNTGAKT